MDNDQLIETLENILNELKNIEYNTYKSDSKEVLTELNRLAEALEKQNEILLDQKELLLDIVTKIDR